MKPRVLVVDDEPDFVELLQFNLGHRGYEILTAANGVEALHQARRHLPDLILLDLMLPDIDGASVFDILCAQPSTTDVPVIVVSALTGWMMPNRKNASRLSAHFQKPVDMQALDGAMRKALAERESKLKPEPAEEGPGSEV
ncbi:MAG: response regulator [Verrucomicrobiota bacterium]